MQESEEKKYRLDSSQTDTDTETEENQKVTEQEALKIETEQDGREPEMLYNDTEDEATEAEEDGAEDEATEMAENEAEDDVSEWDEEKIGEYHFDDFISSDEDSEEEEDLLASLNESLMRQVAEELDEEGASKEKKNGGDGTESKMRKKQNKILLTIGSIFLSLIILIGFLAGTYPGRRFVYWMAGKFIHKYMNNGPNQPNEVENPDITSAPAIPDEEDDPIPTEEPEGTPIPIPEDHSVRKEEYVKNFLIFGIEQINGASNTDTIMIASINTKDKTVRLVSVLRDLYVELSDGIGRKVNSVYARGRRDGQGPELLMATLEQCFKIDLEGYAYVNFASFEKIVDLLGGVTIDLGATEAEYLRKTNYISNPAYRTVTAGVNRLNGNQVVGYCRVRKVPTKGGAANDYGRTLRQRRVLTAIFNEYKSKNIFDLLSITTKCLGEITSDLSADQIANLLEMVVENGITTMEGGRVPIENSFYDSGKSGHNGVTYGLVISDPAANIKYLFQFLYGDTEEEAEMNYNALD